MQAKQNLANTRAISLEAPREPLAGSEPGINIQNEDAWPEWRKKNVKVCSCALSVLATTLASATAFSSHPAETIT
jgi:hypothetical protein